MLDPKINTLYQNQYLIPRSILDPKINAWSQDQCLIPRSMLDPKINTWYQNQCLIPRSILDPKINTWYQNQCLIPRSILDPKINAWSQDQCLSLGSHHKSSDFRVNAEIFLLFRNEWILQLISTLKSPVLFDYSLSQLLVGLCKYNPDRNIFALPLLL